MTEVKEEEGEAAVAVLALVAEALTVERASKTVTMLLTMGTTMSSNQR